MPLKTPIQLAPDSAILMERSKGVFFAQWEELLRLRRAIGKKYDPDDIHDLRVASRRFRAALELLEPFLPNASKKELKKAIRSITRVLGGIRNIDEALLFFEARVGVDTTAYHTLRHTLSRLHSKELRRMEKALAAFEHRKMDRIVRKLVAGMGVDRITGQSGFSLLPYLSEVSLKQYLPIHQLLSISTAPEQHAVRHSLRIAIKKWRYFLEIIAQVLGHDYTPVLDLLKEYQSLLGRMNDIAEFKALLYNLKLDHDDQELFEAILLSEDALLLGNFTLLIRQKPLDYRFIS